MRKRIRRPSPAMAVALASLFVALGGTASALVITSSQIADRTIQSRDIGIDQIGKANVGDNAFGSREAYDGALGGIDIKDNDLKGADIDEGTVGASGRIGANGGVAYARNATIARTAEGVYCVTLNYAPTAGAATQHPLLATVQYGSTTTPGGFPRASAEVSPPIGGCQGWVVLTYDRDAMGKMIRKDQPFVFLAL